MNIVKKNQLKIVIFTAVKNRCILYGRVFVMHTKLPSFLVICPAVPEQKIFEGFYHIWAWRQSWSCDQQHILNFNFHVPKSLHKNLVKNGPLVPEKSKF